MKNLNILIVFIITLSCKAQSPIVDIDTWNGDSQENAYYKDVHNYFNDFEGTWLYTNGSTSFKIVLEKKTMAYTGKFYMDYMIGEYLYIENGIEKINTLPNLSQPRLHSIVGSTLLDNSTNSRPYCPTCPANERRLKVGLYDRPRKLTGTFTLKKVVISGQSALEGYLWGDGVPGGINEDNPPQYTELTVPTGTFIFVKQ